MGIITVTHKGSFAPTRKFLKNASSREYLANLDSACQRGVAALQAATPVDSGETASAWSYEIIKSEAGISIKWYNSSLVAGVPLIILLQYGHGTRNGGYVQGQDIVNPALAPIFDEIANQAWAALVTA